MVFDHKCSSGCSAVYVVGVAVAEVDAAAADAGQYQRHCCRWTSVYWPWSSVFHRKAAHHRCQTEHSPRRNIFPTDALLNAH